jgi:photosystem II protein PsbQ
MMKFIRPFLSVVLVLITTLLVSCGEAKVAIPTTYTDEQVTQLQLLSAPITAAKESMSTLQNMIETENWVDTRTFIHGPLGGTRQTMTYVARNLLQKDRSSAAELAKDFFSDLEKIDVAAMDKDYGTAVSAFRSALKDIDSYLDLVP